MVAINRARDKLQTAQIVIIKVGSALLVDEQQHRINEEWLAGCLGELEVRDCRVANALVLQLKLEAVFRGTDVRCTELSQPDAWVKDSGVRV